MKKYFEKFKDLKSTNKKLYYATICMFVLVGFTFAYVIDQISGGAISKVFITADTADNLQFEVDKDISIKPTQFNFTQGGVDLSDTATATARLKANSTDNTATYSYNVYFQITTNEYIYTTEDKKPEMILQVTNPNGENVTSMSGLTYNETLNGFDITNLVDYITIAENYEISSNSSTSFTEQNWIITVKFINLDTNQIENEGKTLEGKVLIQRQEYGDINIAVNNLPEAYGPLAEINCNGNNSVYNQKYNRIEISNKSLNKSFCNLNYKEPQKRYLNDYIISLTGTTQGNGEVINETYSVPNFENAVKLTEDSYGTVTQITNTSANSTSGTTVTDAFTFEDSAWKTNNMISGQYYHISFTMPSNDYYQICYEMSIGNVNNSMYINYDNYMVPINGAYGELASSSNTKTGCVYLGYVSNTTTIRVVQYAYSSISTISFSVQKTTNPSSNSIINTGYRYEGRNPNNYVWFNNELWRIIGVMNSLSHGQSNQNLVKIIRNDSIGSIMLSENDANNWRDTELFELLNTGYLHKKDLTYTSYCFGYAFNGTYIQSNCDYRVNGISEKSDAMIANVKWYEGTISNYSTPELQFESILSTSNVNYGKIGLMYGSDYGFSVLEKSCDRNISLNGYNNNNCYRFTWLFYGQEERIITKYVDGRGMAIYDGNVNYTMSGYGYDIRPVLYLDSSVYILNGTGTELDPYIIGM